MSIDRVKFDYDNISLNFKDREIEDEFGNFSFRYDSQSLKILSIGIIVGNLFFISIDWPRTDDLLGTLIFRGGVSGFMILGVLNSRFVNNQNPNLLQPLAFIISIGLVTGFFLAHNFLNLPDYSLPNAIYTLMFLTVLFSGLRFKYSMIYAIIVYIIYIIFSTQVFVNHFWNSQINNLTINMIVILAGAYMMEKYKRNIFVTNHIIDIQRKDLESSNNLKDNLLSVLSHDLRGPIGKLITILNLWRGKNISQKELIEFTQKIELEVERTSSLMDNLLFWSKSMIQGNQKITRQIYVYEIIQKNVSFYKEKLKSKEISCAILVSPKVKVRLDVNTLNLCLRNLISNAIKFTNKNGIIEIGYNANNLFAEFYVSDNGVGISDTFLKKLYDLDFNSCAGTSGEQGTGLGLYLLKEFLDNIGGSIRCESKPGKGTNFIFSLPKE